MKNLRNFFKELTYYPSAIFGLLMIALLILTAIYALVTIPHEEAIRLWRGGEGIWQENPRNARPAWLNILPGYDEPRTIIVDSADPEVTKTVQDIGHGINLININIPFEYKSTGFPREVQIFFETNFEVARPHMDVYWITPDGREIFVADRELRREDRYRLDIDTRLRRRLDGLRPQIGLFLDPEADEPKALPGHYEVQLEAMVFEEDADISARLVVYGQVHGLAGTDHRRRDLALGLLYGTPIAMAFGILAAVFTSITTMFIAATGVWFGRWVDGIIQRLTELNLILNPLAILIMVGTFYSRSIWVMLGVLIVLNIFSGAIKTYRAMFLQVKEAPFIEAAQAYGAGHGRVIFRYLIPRMVPMLIPSFVLAIPNFVFIEATLAMLGLGDPILPTWGKILHDAYHNGALFNEYYYWVIQPAALLMLTGLGFAMVGFSLDRIFNPRLRGV